MERALPGGGEGGGGAVVLPGGGGGAAALPEGKEQLDLNASGMEEGKKALGLEEEGKKRVDGATAADAGMDEGKKALGLEDESKKPVDGATAADAGTMIRGMDEGKNASGMDEGKNARGLEEEGKNGATAADAGTMIPWSHRHLNAYKPAPPVAIRTISAPRTAAPPLEMWTRATREEVSYAAELENISKSLLTIGSGFGKVFTGFGLKIISPKEKEAAAAEEKKKIEDKKVAEQVMAAEENLAIAKLNPSEMEEWKKKEEEKRKAEEEAQKEKRLALMLSVPDNLVNISSVLCGLGEIASGSKDVTLSICLMVRGVPALVRRARATSANWIGQGSSSKCSIMGRGSIGLRMALDRQVLTRVSDGRISVVDAFGSKIEKVPRALGGTLIVSNEEELYEAIAQFNNGQLRQLIDVDGKIITLKMAWNLWRHLCNENLTGLLCPTSQLPEMALQAGFLINEANAVEYQLQEAEHALKDIKMAVKAHQSSINELHDRLHQPRNGTLPKVEDL